MALNEDPVGTRIVSKFVYESGKVSARIVSGATAPGLVSSLYLSDSEPLTGDERKQFEVDFELMGTHGNRHVQTAGLPRKADYGKSSNMSVSDVKFTHGAAVPV